MAQKADAIKWYRTPIPRDELRKLTARRDLPALAQSVGFLLVILTTGTGAWIAWDAAAAGTFPIWGVALLVFLHGTMWAFLLQGFHELVHYTVFRTKALGTFFLYLYSLLGWFNPIDFKASHKRHHLYTLHPPKDREVRLPIRLRFWHYLRVAVIDLYGVYGRVKGFVITATGGFTSDWQRDNFEDEGPAETRKLRTFARAHLLFHAALTTVAIITGTYQLIVLVTLASFYGRWLQFLCNETQHIGLVDNVPDFRLCCRTFTANPVIRFLYWNMNYHTEHHMYAAVPCYNLHKLHLKVRHELPAWPRGIVATWRQIISILRRQYEDPEYQFIPEVPPAAPARVAGD
ncbi:MAG: fatty acid desaturase [Spirochaetales bacterium]